MGTSAREERARRFGIDCGDRLVWQRWEPGQEYSKKLILKNVDSKTQTFEFRLPAHRQTFLTPFPEPITLRSGMHYELEVRFCPAEVEELHDSIEVSVKDRGSFAIELAALTPYARLRVPEKHDFGFCAVMTTVKKEITVKNTGTVPLEFYWELPVPFEVHCESRELQPGETLPATVLFTPTEACAVVGKAVCRITGIGEVIASMLLSGVGKFPFVAVAEADPLALPAPPPFPRVERDPPTLTRINFGAVLVGRSAAHTISVTNPSPVDAAVSVVRSDDGLSCPFRVTPAEAVIPRGGTQQFKVVFKARQAGLLHVNAFQLQALAGNIVRLELRGEATGPRVTVSASSINFGDVNLEALPPPKQRTRLVQLRNASAVEAHYQFLNTSPGAAFTVFPAIGTIPPEGAVKVAVTFEPAAAVGYLRRLLIAVAGGPDALVVDVFGSGYTSRDRPLPMTLPMVDAHHLRIARGLGFATPDELEAIAASVMQDLAVESDAELQLQQLWLQIEQDAGNLGGGAGGGAGGDGDGDGDGGFYGDSDNDGAGEDGRRTDRFLQRRATRLDFRQAPPTSRINGVLTPFVLDSKSLLFMGGGGGALPPSQLVTLHNPTAADVTAVWAVPHGSPFRVQPDVLEVPAGETKAFQVSLAGDDAGGQRASGGGGDACVVAQDLECYVNYTAAKSFRTVTPFSYTPPHCLTLQCRYDPPGRPLSAGAGAGGEKRAAAIKAPALVSFPPCGLQDTVCQVVALENTSDAPVLFEVRSVMLHGVSERVAEDVAVVTIDEERGTSSMSATEASRALAKMRSLDSVFSCVPSAGLLPPGQRALLLVQMVATSHARFEADASLMLNNDPSDMVTMQLRGEGAVPRLVLEDPLQLREFRGVVFRPTCVTGETTRALRLYNPTRMRIRYRCVPSAEIVGVMRVEPAEGVLGPGERAHVRACFAPEVPRRHEGTLAIVMQDVSPTPLQLLPSAPAGAGADDGEGEEAGGGREHRQDHGNSDGAVQEFVMSFHVQGEGRHASVEVEPVSIDCGESTGLQPRTVAFTVYNSGLCEVTYEVRALVCQEPRAWRERNAAPQLRNHAGTLPARSHAQVLATVAPSVGDTEYVLYCLVGGCGSDLSATAAPATAAEATQHPHCRLRIRGTQPALRVADVRSLTVQRSHLWRQLSVNHINEQLLADVVPEDVAAGAYAFPQYIAGLTPVAVDLGVGPVGGVPMRATVLLENVCDRAVSFRFWLPTDTDASSEHWHLEDAGLQDIQHVIDAGLIEVSPARGTVEVGGTVAVTVSHRLEEPGVHTLPVLLRVSDGKRVLLVLEGRTLPRGVPGLALHHPAVYELLPVALGDVEPPMQSITIDNPFPADVRYAVAQGELEELARRNHGFPVLQCVNPAGTMPPRSIAQLWWYFRPLEEKTYTMTVTLQTEGGEAYTLTFVGRGYHPRRTSPDAVRAGIDRALLRIPPYPVLAGLPGDSSGGGSSDPAVPVTLSTHVLAFGPLPYFALERRACLLTNRHPTDTYSFQWDTQHGFGDHVVSVVPAAGELRPGASAECRLTLYTGCTSQLLEWPATCYIVNETVARQQQQRQAPSSSSGGGVGMGAGSAMGTARGGAGGGDDDDEDQDLGGTGVRVHDSVRERQQQQRASRPVALPRARGGQRRPVTDAPLESLSLDRLHARLRATQQRAGDPSASASASAGTGAGAAAVVWNSLELLLQARIMPADDYEQLADAEAAAARYQPAKSMYADPAGPQLARAGGPVDDVVFVRGVMDEMLRAVLAQPRVQEALTGPSVSDAPRYEDVASAAAAAAAASAATAAAAAAAAVTAGTSAEHTQKGEGEEASAALAKSLATGFAGNALEEALEAVIYDVVRTVMQDENVMSISTAMD